MVHAICRGLWLVLVALVPILALPLMALPTAAGILVEGQVEGVPVRLEMGADRSRVLVSLDGAEHLVDLDRQHVYVMGEGRPRRIRAALEDDGATLLPYDLERWSPGPPVAGHASTYHVLQVGEEICGEVLASRWMRAFLEPVIETVGLMQRLDSSIRPPRQSTECGAIPFSVYARNGWPLMAGWRDYATFLTETVSFDHNPDPAAFELPSDFVE